ncbi:hypothetical protein HMPREF1588_03723 [Escherichia coli 110957]|nr:hypothetical protein HMPREF1588_03723 [Escherichia coli 110957]ESE04487.1 hypothetical protein HMPREF1616_03024 [Escherichia coli 908658]
MSQNLLQYLRYIKWLKDKKPFRVVLTRSNFMVGDLYVYSTQKVTEKVLTE